MCIFKEVERFIRNGVCAFRDASIGQYKGDSEAISELRKELLEKNSDRSEDKKNLMEDRKHIERDVCVSFNEMALNNG